MLNAQAERPTDVYIIQYYTLCPDRGLRNFTRSSAADYSRPAEHSRAQASTAEHSRPQPSTAEHRRAQPSTADYSRLRPSTRAQPSSRHSRLRPTTADYGRAPKHSRAADYSRPQKKDKPAGGGASEASGLLPWNACSDAASFSAMGLSSFPALPRAAPL